MNLHKTEDSVNDQKSKEVVRLLSFLYGHKQSSNMSVVCLLGTHCMSVHLAKGRIS